MKLNIRNYKPNELIKILRENLNKSQEEFAKDIGISTSAIQKYEYGTVNYPFEVLDKIIKKYDLNMTIEERK